MGYEVPYRTRYGIQQVAAGPSTLVRYRVPPYFGLLTDSHAHLAVLAQLIIVWVMLSRHHSFLARHHSLF